MTTQELYEAALLRQQIRRLAVVKRHENVVELRDPWAMYDTSNCVVYRVPQDLRPRGASCIPTLVSHVFDALMLLQRDHPKEFTAVMERGLRSGWVVHGAAGSYVIRVPMLPQRTVPEPATVVAIGGRLRYVSEGQMADTFHLIGGVRRLVRWAQRSPEEFSGLCGDIFGGAV